MKAPPQGWPRISTTIWYEDPRKAIDWLGEAFGFELQLLVGGDGDEIVHSEMTFGGGLIMVSGPRDRFPHCKPPSMLSGATTQALMVYVDDIDAHYTRAKKAGAKISEEPETHDYGDDYWADKAYGCIDPGGHQWWFAERLTTKGVSA